MAREVALCNPGSPVVILSLSWNKVPLVLLVTVNVFIFQIYGVPKAWSVSRIREIILLVIRYTFWHLFVELWLHFIYISSLGYEIALFRKMDLWTLSGLSSSKGLFFMMKYLSLYGITRPLMKIDGIEPPDQPKCILHIHRYSDMWRYFDVGHHRFMRRYY